MSNLRTSCLVLFLFFSLFHHLSCASSKKEPGWCEALFQCGNIPAGFPFSGRNRPEICGHPLLELRCNPKNHTSLIISNHPYHVLHINQTSNTLRLARKELRGPFCNATFTNATLPPEIFELSPNYKSLTVFYLCNRNLTYPSSNTCLHRGPVLVSQNPKYHDTCRDSFTINVPKSYIPEEKVLNLINLENTLKEGFEVKVKVDEKACQECKSTHGICGFQNTIQACCKETSPSECNTLHPPKVDEYHRNCSQPFICGDQNNLSYPFWVPDRKACGHPDFELDCSRGFAELSISSVKFRILYMSHNSPIIKLARSENIDNVCPSDPPNAPFNQTVLQLVPGTDLVTLYYDCKDHSLLDPASFLGDLPCGEDDTRRYYVTTNLSPSSLNGGSGLLDNFKTSCGRNVSIPVSTQALDEVKRSPTTDDLEKALDQNFDLELNHDCTECKKSGGVCGYNWDSKSFNCYCEDHPHSRTCKNKGLSTGKIAVIGTASGLVGLFLIAVVVFGLNSRRRKTSDDSKQHNLKDLIPLKHYSYAQIMKITKSFDRVVGKGGFGTVYKGTLFDGRSVAVKVLKDSTGNEEDFVNEVASMSKTSHVNIVDLLGFCSEGSKRAILYEFLENGSLDRFISRNTSMSLDWTTLFHIALGVARALEYLHHGCKAKIVHFDIKPQNILLDDNLSPKVSDFGLAKLCGNKESIISLLGIRGTIGYIAPEVFSRMYGSVSQKSDVYSYGMLVLEMIGARDKKPSDQKSASNTSSMYFPEWIYKDLEKGYRERLTENEEEETKRKMTVVGLWCIQSSPSNRPSMNRVVEMMEGNLNALELPPRPVLQQFPAMPLSQSRCVSEESSSPSHLILCSTN